MLAARGSMLGSSVMTTDDEVIVCAPKEYAIFSFIWMKGMGKVKIVYTNK